MHLVCEKTRQEETEIIRLETLHNTCSGPIILILRSFCIPGFTKLGCLPRYFSSLTNHKCQPKKGKILFQCYWLKCKLCFLPPGGSKDTSNKGDIQNIFLSYTTMNVACLVSVKLFMLKWSGNTIHGNGWQLTLPKRRSTIFDKGDLEIFTNVMTSLLWMRLLLLEAFVAWCLYAQTKFIQGKIRPNILILMIKCDVKSWAPKFRLDFLSKSCNFPRKN